MKKEERGYWAGNGILLSGWNKIISQREGTFKAPSNNYKMDTSFA